MSVLDKLNTYLATAGFEATATPAQMDRLKDRIATLTDKVKSTKGAQKDKAKEALRAAREKLRDLKDHQKARADMKADKTKAKVPAKKPAAKALTKVEQRKQDNIAKGLGPRKAIVVGPSGREENKKFAAEKAAENKARQAKTGNPRRALRNLEQGLQKSGAVPKTPKATPRDKAKADRLLSQIKSKIETFKKKSKELTELKKEIADLHKQAGKKTPVSFGGKKAPIRRTK